MAAGLGFKTFTTGEVLTAADTNGYLMQGVLVFASAAARDADITSPQEGQFAYLKDTNVTTYYTGSAWANLDTTGMTNPMTTTGDTIYSSSGSTPARLGIGTTGQVLTVAGGIPSWATSSSGSMTLLSTTSLSGASVTISSISGSYTHLWINISGLTANTGATNTISLEFNGVGADGVITTQISNNVVGSNSSNASWNIGEQASGATSYFNGFLYDYSSVKLTSLEGMWGGKDQFTYNRFTSGFFNRDAAITSIKILANNTTMTAGSLKIYGVK